MLIVDYVSSMSSVRARVSGPGASQIGNKITLESPEIHEEVDKLGPGPVITRSLPPSEAETERINEPQGLKIKKMCPFQVGFPKIKPPITPH